MAQKGKYMDQRHDSKSYSTTDKVMEPLTRLFTDLVAQIKLLTPSGQNGPSQLRGDCKAQSEVDRLSQ